MPRHSRPRPHPVYSLRFWFLVLAVVGFTAAWKLELLPNGKAPPQTVRPGDHVELGDASDAEDAPPSDADVLVGQTEPLPVDGSGVELPEPRVMPRAATIAQSPFGTASPEFVSAPTPLAPPPVPGSRVSPDDAPSFTEPSAPAESILQAANESAPEAPNPFVEQADSSVESPTYDFTEIDANLDAGTKDADVAAHRALSELYWQRPELRPQLADRIEQTALRIYFQPQPHYFDEYHVQPGETLQAIARRYSVSWEYLERLNDIQAPRLKAGQTLKVIKGPFAAVVDLSDYEITIHCHGHYVDRFPVGIGKDGSTPIGSCTVDNKVVNPRYDGPEGSIEPDDPANPIGERWISLGNGYGIHGTIHPESIGKSESRGCIRMHNADVGVVYDLLTIGSEVVVQR
jgi:lipoprotein-anchoring transpeptidase ErfK/SrfK